MPPKKHLSFGSLRKGLSALFNDFSDTRESAKTDYSIHDAVMSGFACMYFQDPSLLQFQERLKDTVNRSNLETLFAVNDIPGQSQLRDITDEVESEQFRPIFNDYFSRLQRNKHLQQYQLFPDLYICSVDATQYFHSQSINCDACLTSEHKNGTVSYSHKVLQAAIMHPDVRQVIPLMPEEIKNTDGNTKQDCEINAAKRIVPKIKKDHPQLGIIITGDGLFSKQPFISDVLNAGYHYIFIAKPNDHKYLIDKLYQTCRKKFGSKRHMWETLRAYIKILVYETWEHLLDFALTPTKYQPTIRRI